MKVYSIDWLFYSILSLIDDVDDDNDDDVYFILLIIISSVHFVPKFYILLPLPLTKRRSQPTMGNSKSTLKLSNNFVKE